MGIVTIAGLGKTTIPMAERIVRDGDVATIDCRGAHYRDMNEAVRAAASEGARTVRLLNVNGQRYIGTGMRDTGVRIEVHGTPGQAVAMFMDGPQIEIYGNAQDGVGNTMNSGEVTVHGNAGDVLGYGMRRGRIFVEGDVGYRAGIHMKADDGDRPVIVCGGKARDYFGEYMAGGLLVLLGMHSCLEGPIVGGHVGAGMHGGEIYVRGQVEQWQHGPEVRVTPASHEELAAFAPILADYSRVFGIDHAEILAEPFTRIVPTGHRPYAGLYAYL